MELLWWVFLAETTSSNTLKACVAAKPAPWARPAAATYRGRAALLPGTQQLTRFSLPQLTVLLLGGTRRNEAGRDLRARSCQKMPQAHAAMHKPSAWHAVPLALGPGLGAGASSQAGQRGPSAASGGCRAPQHLYLLRCTYYKPCSQKAATELPASSVRGLKEQISNPQ